MSVKIDRLAILGAGKMGITLLSALTASGVVKPKNVVATARTEARLASVRERFDIHTTRDNREAVGGADVILLCVKPQTAGGVIDEIRNRLEPNQVLLSIIAGLTTKQIEEHLGDRRVPVVRAMPNTPSRVGQGMTAVCGGLLATQEHLEMGRAIFSEIGRALVLDEKYFDAVTGLSASGPAFLYVVIEALAEGGVKMGLPRKVATELAAQTCLGAGHMVLETGDHPALLKDEVTTPAGCTVDGILALETGGLRVTLINAVVQSCRRAGGLVND